VWVKEEKGEGEVEGVVGWKRKRERGTERER